MQKKQVEFNSFFMGGFECADHINRSGNRINLLTETAHHLKIDEDYQLLANLGIKVVREGICWSMAEKQPYIFDFQYLKKFIDVAKKYGIQIIWDLCHFGYPDDLIPTHPQFDRRFMALCRAFALFHKSYTEEQLFIVPINEISFLSWHSGDMRGTVPFAINSGFDIKYHLCRAAIAGMQVLRETHDSCIILLVEPLVKIHAEDHIPAEEVEILNSHQYQAMDMISGTMLPELGGSSELFDMLGFNYYYDNQWIHGRHILPWPEIEQKMTPFSQLLETAYKRYKKPLILSETGHFGDNRPRWIEEITLQCQQALDMGIDLKGICIYPVIDRPDWDDLSSYSNCGLWDMDKNKNRVPHVPTIRSLQHAMKSTSPTLKGKIKQFLTNFIR